jgi:hypothetical protein
MTMLSSTVAGTSLLSTTNSIHTPSLHSNPNARRSLSPNRYNPPLHHHHTGINHTGINHDNRIVSRRKKRKQKKSTSASTTAFG